jgi:hypothetical protein
MVEPHTDKSTNAGNEQASKEESETGSTKQP